MRGWDGVMQSYYVDQWEHASGSCSRRPSPRSPSAAPGCSAPADAHQEAMLDFGHVGSIGVHLCDASVGPGRARHRGLAARHLQAHRRRRRPARLRDRPRRRSPLRRRRHRGLPEHRPGRSAAAGRPGRVRGRPASSPPSCASRPSTRWAPRGSPPTRARASAPRRLGQRHRAASTSPTPPSSPPRSASTR